MFTKFSLALPKLFPPFMLRFVFDLGEFWSNSVRFVSILHISPLWKVSLLHFNIDDITSRAVCVRPYVFVCFHFCMSGCTVPLCVSVCLYVCM